MGPKKEGQEGETGKPWLLPRLANQDKVTSPLTKRKPLFESQKHTFCFIRDKLNPVSKNVTFFYQL